MQIKLNPIEYFLSPGSGSAVKIPAGVFPVNHSTPSHVHHNLILYPIIKSYIFKAVVRVISKYIL